MSATATLAVLLQGPSGDWVEVGRLHSRDNRNWFTSDTAYWSRPDRPVLGQVFEDHDRGWSPSTRVALPRWFSHLLPQGALRHAVADAAQISSVTEFAMLRRLGEADLPGAVRVVEASAADAAVTAEAPPDASEEESPDDSAAVLKFSLAGLQMKFSMSEHADRLTIPARGAAGNVIVKLPDWRPGFPGVPRAEHAVMQLAQASGIDVPRTRLVPSRDLVGIGAWADSDEPSYVIDRFDRMDQGGGSGGTRRVHVEEFAQVLDVATARAQSKYDQANFETIARTASRLAGPDAVGEVIDRIVLNVLVGNGDAHLKNWAFVYPDGRNPVLSPAYDLVPTVLYLSVDDLGLKLNGSRDFADVTTAGFSHLGEASDIGGAAAVGRAREAVGRVRDAWPLLAELLPREQRTRLDERLRDLPLAAG